MTATLDWMGCATFRLTLDNQVVMLDAYIDRVPSVAPIKAAMAHRAPHTELAELGYMSAYPVFA